MFKTNFSRLFERLDQVNSRLEQIERRLEALEQDGDLRGQLDRLREENRALGEQGLQVVDQLDQALRRVRELEQG